MPFWNWSKTAASNGTSDPTAPFPEGMSPSAVNDGVRAIMARLSEYRDDISGFTATAGSSTAYTYSSFQVFDSLAHMNGAMIAFTPHATNGATVTLNVDGLGAKPLQSSPGVELLAATIIQGTPYVATYNNGIGAGGLWILQGFYGNPYNIPLLGGMDYWGSTAPNSSFVMPFGQALSRTTYAAAFAILGTSFGAGDGSTTFNIPDKRGLVSAGTDNMGGVSGGRMPGLNPGSIQGSSTQTLTIAQIPGGLSASVSGTVTVVSNSGAIIVSSGLNTFAAGGGGSFTAFNAGTAASGQQTSTGSNSMSGTAGGGGGSHPIVQPTIGVNYIMRII